MKRNSKEIVVQKITHSHNWQGKWTRKPSDRKEGDLEYSTCSRDTAEATDLTVAEIQKKISQCGKTRKP
jgi:hypothetical protein